MATFPTSREPVDDDTERKILTDPEVLKALAELDDAADREDLIDALIALRESRKGTSEPARLKKSRKSSASREVGAASCRSLINKPTSPKMPFLSHPIPAAHPLGHAWLFDPFAICKRDRISPKPLAHFVRREGL